MTHIAFIGLGVMGRPMAHNLLRAGHELTVHNRSRGPVEELVGHGAVPAESPAEAAQDAEVVITMLPDAPDVIEVVHGAFTTARPGTLLIDMSTISPLVVRQLSAQAAERGMVMLDAPVSGGSARARDGTLSIMIGGRDSDVERARPIFEVLGRTIVHVGETGTGQVVKACNQLVVAVTIEAVLEALLLGSKAGVDRELMLDVLSSGSAANRLMDRLRRNFLDHDFSTGFRFRYIEKDLAIALECGRMYRASLPATAVASQLIASP
jgi:2-hydroxy-3-oxopropionate reductase